MIEELVQHIQGKGFKASVLLEEVRISKWCHGCEFSYSMYFPSGSGAKDYEIEFLKRTADNIMHVIDDVVNKALSEPVFAAIDANTRACNLPQETECPGYGEIQFSETGSLKGGTRAHERDR